MGGAVAPRAAASCGGGWNSRLCLGRLPAPTPHASAPGKERRPRGGSLEDSAARPPGRQASRVAIEPPAGQLAHPETRLLSTTLSPPGHVGQAHEVTGTSVADISRCWTWRRAGQAAARPQQPLDQAAAPVAFGTVPAFVP